MRVLCKTLQIVAAVILALVVAGFMLAFINSDSREFFLAVFVAPVALIFHAMSAMLDPRQHSVMTRQR